MTLDQWHRVKAILDTIAQNPPTERDAILDRECGDDRALRLEAERFLALDQELDDEFMDEPLWTFLPASEAAARPNSETDGHDQWQRIGPYRIERLLGRGGMGEVFLAQREGDYRQQVALKVIGGNRSNDQLLSRFVNERQILANLQHPGIARLLDGGTAEDGRPFIVMEYVDGMPIDEYCDQNDLTVTDRLVLFRRVCSAVQYAHQNLVVHRDLKSSNILVLEDGTPRLLDFGIAKLLDFDPAKTATAPGIMPLTPLCASPEQILNQPITTACDVYALGVLLYRLLSGHPPYDLRDMGYQDLVAAICIRTPKRPSAVAGSGHAELDTSTTWQRPRATPIERAEKGDRKRYRQLAGDLDAIVLKAMRKKPRHRYGSVAALSADIKRHLGGHAVHARRGTWLYLTGKLVRRRWPALIVLLLIVGFSIATTVLWQRAVGERRVAQRHQERAEHQQHRAEQVTEFLEGLFRFANPDETQGEAPSVYEILERGRKGLTEGLEDQAEIRAELFGTLGTVYQNLGNLEASIELNRQALSERRRSDPDDRPALAKDINNLATLQYAIGDYPGAEASFREALAMRQRLGQADQALVNTMFNLAATLVRRGSLAEAETLHQRCLTIRQAVYGPNSDPVATSLYSLATLEATRGEFVGAETLLRRALDIRLALLGPEHTKVAQVRNSLGRTLQALDRHDEARESFEHALRTRRARLGDDHVSVAQTRKGLASLLLDQGEIDAAGAMIENALETLREAMPASNFAIVDAERVLGEYLIERQRYAEAESHLLPSLRALTEIRGPDATATRAAIEALVHLYESWGQPERAVAHRQSLETSRTRTAKAAER